MVRHRRDEYRWEGVDVHPYKEEGGTHFKSITRQTLFHGDGDLAVELRYFEIAPGGHSTLERHEHAHLVTIIRGRGQVLVGDEISEVGLYDVVTVPPFTWHQFRATKGDHLGFLCVVSSTRDKAQRPGETELEQLRSSEPVSDFIRA
ncbi:MAG TPA: cupin domain-containing protein [Fimbriimonadaceae bacterium]|nr:cupin domain-containing protein [Fimbriimonadaceae bacterium]